MQPTDHPTPPTAPNGQPVIHPHASALAAGAKALRVEARKFAFDAGLYADGIRTPGGKQAHTAHTRLLRYAGVLEGMAGRRKVGGNANQR